MREARIILPTDVAPAATDWLQAELADQFGGYTRTFGHGAWREPATGKLIEEPIAVYDIAVGEQHGPYDHWSNVLRETAITVGRMAGQQSVYVRYPDGYVTIHEIAHKCAAA